MTSSAAIHATDTGRGRIVLSIAHVAGMIDMAALPVWVGTLISRYAFSPQQAGGLVTIFLAAVVAASLVCAPLFRRLAPRIMAPVGFAIAAAAFLGLSSTADYGAMALLHALAGLAVGVALSFTHGTMGRTTNPHRAFAIAGMALGVFAVVFLGGAPKLIDARGGPVLFQVLGGLMVFATIVTGAAFPSPPEASSGELAARHASARIPAAVWSGIAGISLMALMQAMMFSFMERTGMTRGFGAEKVQAVLVAVGFVNLLPAIIAGALQHRVPAHRVLMAGPVAQAVLALVITQSSSYAPYALACSVYVFVMIFTHIFAFGMFASRDPSGRAVAATPAMVMTGSAIGPALGGVLVQNAGYEWLGYAIAGCAVIAVLSFRRVGATPQVLDSANAAVAH